MSNLFNEVKQNELFDLQKLGWLEAGTESGQKLSAKGLAEGERILTSLSAKERVVLKYLIGNNADANPIDYM